MEFLVIDPVAPLPVDRAWTLAMTIMSFKGRRDVQVHLFRPAWDPAEEAALPWDELLGEPMPGAPGDAASARRVVLESFTPAERDQVLAFLKTQYATRLSRLESRPLSFPVPVGLPALSDVTEGKNIGLIRFEKIPSCHLTVPLHGLYNLAQHPPLVLDPAGS
ncbi:MAG: hypothetical protein AB7D57_06120 [Desulfovibrionaceae bacterium]